MRELPEFPWHSLTPYREKAWQYRDGAVDLSVGTPVDATPSVVQEALQKAAAAPGYPPAAGTPELLDAAVGWLERRFGVTGLDPAGVLPAIGSKEFVAWLPTLLNIGPGDVVEFPDLAYPTYDVGARLAGATPVPAGEAGSQVPRLIWQNTPANPHGAVATIDGLSAEVRRAREIGAVLAVDECYVEFCWDAEPVSVLDARVNEGSLEGVLAVHSLSKRSNMAGYRAGFVAGDPSLIARLLEWRRHAGLMVPHPVQEAMVDALGDDVHVDEQRARYARRRVALRQALERAGYRIDHSEGGLYLWATRGENCWETVDRMAAVGIVVTPGAFYGVAGEQHIRVALTASDSDVAAAVVRLDG